MAFCPQCGAKNARKKIEAPSEEPKPVETKAQEPKTAEAVAPQAEEPKTAEAAPQQAQDLEKTVSGPKAVMPAQAPKEATPQAQEPAKEKKASKEKKAPKEKKVSAKGVKTSKDGLHRKPSGGKIFISLILCLLMFLAVIFTGVLFSVRSSFTRENIEKTLDSDHVKNFTLPSTKGKGEISLIDFIEEASGFDIEKSAGIEKKELAKFLNKSYVKEMIANILGDYLEYFTKGNAPAEFTEDDFIDFIREHNDDIYKLTGFSFVSMSSGIMNTKDIENAFKDLGTDEIDLNWLKEKTDFPFEAVKMILSLWTMIGLFTLSGVIFVLLLILHGKTMRSGVTFVGVTLTLSGIVLDVAAAIGMLKRESFQSNLIGTFVSPLFTKLLIFGSIVLVLGLLIVIFGRLICNVAAKSKAKKIANA